jgi:type II secretion system protein J
MIFSLDIPFRRARHARGGPRRRHAFTLIEIMVSIVVFSIIIGAIYATLILILRSTQIGREATERAQRERVVMRTIENSLMCVQSFQASQKYYSFIAEGGDQPILSFASRLPGVFPRNGKFPGFNLRRVTYTLEAADGGGKNLVLRQNPILRDMDDDEQKNPLVLARNVKEFTVECWDTNQDQWVDEWDNTNSLPPMVRIGLTLGQAGDDNNLPDNSDLITVRAFSLPSSMMPVAVQTGAGGAGGFGGPGGPGGGLTLPPPH